MAIFTTTPVSIIPANQQSAGTAKPVASALSSNRTVADSVVSALLTQAGTGIGSLQQQIDQIMRALRAPVPQPASVGYTDPKGNLIGWIGYNVVNNVVYEGAWFKEFYAGGDNASNALVTIKNGQVSIDGEIVLIGTNGTISINPAIPEFYVFDDTTKIRTIINGSGIVVENDTSGTEPSVTIAPDEISLTNSASAGVIFISSTGDDGEIQVFDATGLKFVKLDGPTGKVNASAGYEFNGVSGVTSSGSVLSNVSPVTTILQYKDWAGTNQSATVVTGTVLSVSTYGFQGGIRTT